MENKRGPKTDPCGTPNTTDFTSDSLLLTQTTLRRSECQSAQNQIHQEMRFVKSQYHRHNCESRNRGQKITSDSGWEYNGNKTGPRTEPRGTPQTSGLGAGIGTPKLRPARQAKKKINK